VIAYRILLIGCMLNSVLSKIMFIIHNETKQNYLPCTKDVL